MDEGSRNVASASVRFAQLLEPLIDDESFGYFAEVVGANLGAGFGIRVGEYAAQVLEVPSAPARFFGVSMCLHDVEDMGISTDRDTARRDAFFATKALSGLQITLLRVVHGRRVPVMYPELVIVPAVCRLRADKRYAALRASFELFVTLFAAEESGSILLAAGLAATQCALLQECSEDFETVPRFTDARENVAAAASLLLGSVDRLRALSEHGNDATR